MTHGRSRAASLIFENSLGTTLKPHAAASPFAVTRARVECCCTKRRDSRDRTDPPALGPALAALHRSTGVVPSAESRVRCGVTHMSMSNKQKNRPRRPYPSGPLSIKALVVFMAAALLATFWLRRRGIRSFWPYVIGAGSLSWAALYFGGFHPALALVPIVPFMPHAPHDLGLFEAREALRANTLDRFGHWWARPVQFVLLLFGFAN